VFTASEREAFVAKCQAIKSGYPKDHKQRDKIDEQCKLMGWKCVA